MTLLGYLVGAVILLLAVGLVIYDARRTHAARRLSGLNLSLDRIERELREAREQERQSW